MIVRTLAMAFLAACTTVSSGPGGTVDAADPLPPPISEDHELGPYPVSVVLVRHADLTPIEADRVDELASGWLAALLDHPVDWRLAVLPVGADPGVVAEGQFLPTSSGIPWIDAATVDPWAERELLVAPLPAAAADNPVLETLIQMPIEEFSFDDGVLLVMLLSETNDESDVTAKEVGEWLQNAKENFPYREANVAALTTLPKSSCTTEGVGAVFRNLLLHVGGYEIDICDDTVGSRIPAGYLDDIDDVTMILEEPADPETIVVNFSDPAAPERHYPEGMAYDPDTRKLTLVSGWLPTSRVMATVRYQPAP